MSGYGDAPPIVHELLDRIWNECSPGHKSIEIAGGSGMARAYRAESKRSGTLVRIDTPATRERIPAGAPEAWSRWRRFEREQRPWKEIA